MLNSGPNLDGHRTELRYARAVARLRAVLVTVTLVVPLPVTSELGLTEQFVPIAAGESEQLRFTCEAKP